MTALEEKLQEVAVSVAVIACRHMALRVGVPHTKICDLRLR